MNKLIHKALFIITGSFFTIFTLLAVLYCCSVLMVAFSFTVILNTLIFLLIILGVLFVVTLMFSIYITNKTTQYIKDSIVTLKSHPESICSLDNDLLPFFNVIEDQNSRISYFKLTIKEQNEQIQMMMYNLREGLIILSEDFKVKLVNSSAKEMLSPNYKHRENRELIEFTRNEQILNTVQLAKKSKIYQKLTIVTEEKKYFRFYINPVENKGFIILIVDVTKEHSFKKIKKDFASNVSHELKTPLTTINGFAELIANDMIRDSESIKKYASLIQKEGERLLDLIEDIIHLSKIENTSKATFNDEIDVLSVAKDVVARLAPITIDKNISVILNDNTFKLNANKNFIDEVISNLVENSVKYNKENGKVNIDISNNVITVSDTGIGIPEADLPRIFERFYRVDKSRSKESGGTGLGLSIIKNITELYKAKLDIKSTVGIGTIITIDFN